MKKLLLAITIIVSITACSKPETPQPEPIVEESTKSYVGCMRSDYPDITISGISVNDKIIYDLRSACSYSSPLFSYALIHLYSGAFTLSDIVDYDIFPIAEIDVDIVDGSNVSIYISDKTFDDDEIYCDLRDGKEFDKTANVKSVNIRNIAIDIDNENFKTDICRLDIEITLQINNVIRIVYSGESINRPILGGIK